MRRVHILATAGQTNTDPAKVAQDLKEFDAQEHAAPNASGPAAVIQSMDGKEGVKHRKSIGISNATDSQGGLVSHSGTVLSRTATEKISMFENDEQIDKAETII